MNISGGLHVRARLSTDVSDRIGGVAKAISEKESRAVWGAWRRQLGLLINTLKLCNRHSPSPRTPVCTLFGSKP